MDIDKNAYMANGCMVADGVRAMSKPPTPREMLNDAVAPIRNLVETRDKEIAGLRIKVEAYGAQYEGALRDADMAKERVKTLQASLEMANRRCAELLEAQLRMRNIATEIIKQREPQANPEFKEAEHVIGRLADYLRRDAAATDPKKKFFADEIMDMAETRKKLLAYADANLPAPHFPWSGMSTLGLVEAILGHKHIDRPGQVLAEKIKAGLECYLKAKAMAPGAEAR